MPFASPCPCLLPSHFSDHPHPIPSTHTCPRAVECGWRKTSHRGDESSPSEFIAMSLKSPLSSWPPGYMATVSLHPSYLKNCLTLLFLLSSFLFPPFSSPLPSSKLQLLLTLSGCMTSLLIPTSPPENVRKQNRTSSSSHHQISPSPCCVCGCAACLSSLLIPWPMTPQLTESHQPLLS